MRFEKATVFVLALITCVLPGELCAQKHVTITNPGFSNHVVLKALWDVQLENKDSFVHAGRVRLTLTNAAGEQVYSGTSRTIKVPVGGKRLSYRYGIKDENFLKNHLTLTDKEEGYVLNKGFYYLCYTFLEKDTGYGHCLENFVTDSLSPRAISKPAKKTSVLSQLPISIGGTLEYSAQFSDRQNPHQTYPNNFQYLSFRPEIEIFGIPLTGSLLLSERLPNLQNANIYNLRFDANKYRTMMENKAKGKMAGKYENYKNLLQKEQLLNQELGNYKQLLGQNFSDTDLVKFNAIDSLNYLLTDSAEYLDSAQLEMVIGQKKALKAFERKKLLYEEMRGKINSLQDQSDTLASLQKQYKSVQGLDSLKAGKGLPSEKLESLLGSIKDFSIGTTFPNLNDITINGHPVQGINFCATPGNLYFNVLYGEMKRQSQSTDILKQSYSRNAAGVSVGYFIDKKKDSRIRLHILRFKDKAEKKSTSDFANSISYTLPKINHVLSLDAKFSFLDNKLQVEGMLGGASTSTLAASALQEIQPANYTPAKSWLYEIFSQRTNKANTRIDFAFRTNVRYQLGKGTDLSFNAKRIGNDYESFGIPFLARDLFTLEGKIRQYIFRRRISIGSGVVWFTDNLKNTKTRTTQQFAPTFEVSLNYPRYPQIKAMYTPSNMSSSDGKLVQLKSLIVSGGYSVRKKTILSITSANYIAQHYNFNNITGTKLENFSITESIHLYEVNQVSASISRIRNNAINTHVITAGGGRTFFKCWTNTILVSRYTNNLEKKTGYSLESAYAFNNKYRAKIKIYRNAYSSYLNQAPGNIENYYSLSSDFIEHVMTISLIAKL